MDYEKDCIINLLFAIELVLIKTPDLSSDRIMDFIDSIHRNPTIPTTEHEALYRQVRGFAVHKLNWKTHPEYIIYWDALHT